MDIYATIGKKLQLRLNDDCMLLLLNVLEILANLLIFRFWILHEIFVISAPRFVGVYEFGNYIYYFFTDKSEEKIKDGSRVSEIFREQSLLYMFSGNISIY